MTVRNMARDEALAQGKPTYISGIPCRRGHLSERRVSNHNCLECVRLRQQEWRASNPEASRERGRAWQKANPEKIKASQTKYRDANREDLNERSRERRTAPGEKRDKYLARKAVYRQLNAEKIKAAQTKRRQEHPEKIRESARRSYAKDPEKEKQRSKRWREANPEKRAEYWDNFGKEKVRAYREANLEDVKDYQRRWRQENRETVYAYIHKRRALKKGSGGTHTSADLNEIFAAQKGRCALCRINLGSSKHIDHIMPLSRGGSNGRANIQFLCPSCNLSKGAKDPVDFARERGFLI